MRLFLVILLVALWGCNKSGYSPFVTPATRILVSGTFTSYNGVSATNVVRLNGDGTIDTSFVAPSGMTAPRLTVDSFFRPAIIFQSGRSISRLNYSGSADPSFSTAGSGCGVPASSIVTDGQNRIYATCGSFNGVGTNNLVRVNADGTLDSSFSNNVGWGASISSVGLDPLQRVVAGDGSGLVARMNSNGHQDTTFNAAGFLAQNYAIGSDLSGRVIASGDTPILVRYNLDGSTDGTFNQGLGPDNRVLSISVDLLGRILIAGQFTHFNSVVRQGVARLNPDGSLDTTFNATSGPGNYDCAFQDYAGRVVAGGGTSVVRYNPNGSLDSSFTTGTITGGIPTIYSCVASQ